MKKQEARKYYLAQRKNLSPEIIKQYNEQIKNYFFEHCSLEGINYLHTFLPVVKFNEVNTFGIIHQIWKQYKAIKVVVPVTNFDKNVLEHFAIAQSSTLKENHWGILEPINAVSVEARQIDLVLVPLLAYDKQGHRVGYGKGFYDKFLAKCPQHTRKIGLSFFEPVEAIEELNEFDVPLDKVISPNGVMNFR